LRLNLFVSHSRNNRCLSCFGCSYTCRRWSSILGKSSLEGILYFGPPKLGDCKIGRRRHLLWYLYIILQMCLGLLDLQVLWWWSVVIFSECRRFDHLSQLLFRGCYLFGYTIFDCSIWQLVKHFIGLIIVKNLILLLYSI
jgi:hypothetical protein